MNKKNKSFAIVMGILLTGGTIFGVAKFIHSLHHEQTEDAQVEADISPILPRVSGYVLRLFVDDNTRVKAGDTLVILDDRDLRVKEAQAAAALENAVANLAATQAASTTARENVATAEANLEASKAGVELAEVRQRRADQDFGRYSELIKTKSVTQQQYDQAEADRDAAAKQLDVARRQLEQASGEVASRKAQRDVAMQNIALAQSVVKERQADLDLAKLQVSYAIITAPTEGVVSRKSAEIGQLVQAGQSLFALVRDNKKWVVANFKETQLEKMRPGQEVEIDVDAFPGDAFMGKIESISPATGAKFALLPADNASGNFVKVVQRVPVKITLTDAAEKTNLLRAGMNVEVDVHLN